MIGSTVLNGAPLNEAGDGGRFMSGVDIVSAGTVVISVYASANSAAPLEVGPIQALYDVSYIDPQSANPLEIGPFVAQNGVPFSFSPDGLSLGRTGLHSVLHGQPPPVLTVEASSVRPLEIGELTAILAGTVVDAQSATPLEIGSLGMGVAVIVASSQPIEFGALTHAESVTAQAARPLEIGGAGVRFRIAAGGLSLGTSGLLSVVSADAEVRANSATPLEIGDLGGFGMGICARSFYPLQIGAITVSRATTC